jgi:hypothetical protein
MSTVIWLGGPALVGGLLGVGARFSWRRVVLLMAAGLVLALGFVLVVYLRSPIDYSHDPNGCSDCGEYLSRWWEPALVVFVALVGYIFWSLGVIFGLVVRTGARLLASRHRRRVASSSTHPG